jgi:hypothetical protein
VNVMKVLKKPVVVDAVEIDADNYEEVARWCGGRVGTFWHPALGESVTAIEVETLEGPHWAVPGMDLMIRGVRGEFYPIKIDIFDETYDIVNGDPDQDDLFSVSRSFMEETA